MILSVIIPCYNHGQYIQEAIDSVLTYQDQPIEIIIIDDGSIEAFTISKIKELKQKGFEVLQHQNSGLAFSRNAGISAAKGKYILPLDADNKIKADYIRKALSLLENNEADIVYARPIFFGDDIAERKFETKKFGGLDIVFGNYIDACAIFKKEVWIKNKGYDESMPYPGVEDWEFWVNSFFNNFRFYFLDKALYEYRILKNSMIEQLFQEKKYDESRKYIFYKHYESINQRLLEIYHHSSVYLNDQKKPLKTALKYIKNWFISHE